MIRHRNQNWSSIAFSVTGTVLPRVIVRVFLFTAFSSVIVVSLHLTETELKLNPITHSLVGIALGLLLVFRTNASYDRFWEGRKAWEGVTSASQNLVRSAVAFAGTAEDLVPLVTAYAYALKDRLQGSDDLASFAGDLDREVMKEASGSSNSPATITRHLTFWVRKKLDDGLSPPLARSLDLWIGQLIDHQATCERIRNTPMPFAYVVQIRQLLIVYLATLPLVLLDFLGWWSIPALFFVAFALLGIEEAGVEIENPFGTDPNDLPLGDFCEVISKDTALLAEGINAGAAG
ncbi:MAG: bestrophin family protein [Planctomycetaceae bacterium]|jgi:putative membrane protein|nr:bestrophin family protein [Planctomycetaceae bacterium]